MMCKQVVTVRMSLAEHSRLKAWCRFHGATMEGLIRAAVRDLLDAREQECAVGVCGARDCAIEASGEAAEAIEREAELVRIYGDDVGFIDL